jgi:hypothetical protein
MIKPSQVNLTGLSEDNANEAEEVSEPEEVDILIKQTENATSVEGRTTSSQRVVIESKPKRKQPRTKKSQTLPPTYNNPRQRTTKILLTSVTSLSSRRPLKFTMNTSYGLLTPEQQDI